MRAKIFLTFVLICFLIGMFSPADANSSEKEFPLNLLFSRADIPQILENTERPLFREFWQEELKKDFSKDKNFMREAFIYAITGDKKRGENAKKGMLETLKLRRWDYFLEDNERTIGFLMGGRLTAWMSLSYDWCYDLLTKKEREEILRQIAEKGCVPLYRSLYRFQNPHTAGKWDFDHDYPYPYAIPDMDRWPVILSHNNFRSIISGGLTLALFTLQDKDPRVDIWREMVLDSYDRFLKLYTQDGSYDEGVSYCNYAMGYLIYLVEAFQRKEGLNLFDRGNFTGMIDYALALYMPHDLEPYGSVNFGDSGNNFDSSVAFWIARNSRDGLAQYMGENFATKHDLFSLIYYDPTVKAEAPVEKKLFRKLDLDWITTRTGYGVDDLVVAMRSGKATNHEHADRNSIILKAYGEILLADHKHPTYDPNNPGWLLRRAESHNTVLIDGKSHPYHNGEEGTNAYIANAKLVRWGRRQGFDFWASDATQAYQLNDRDVKSVTRTVLVFHDFPALIVIDKFVKKFEPSQFGARWHVENKDDKGSCSATPTGFVIKRPRGKFVATVSGKPEIGVTTDFLPLPKKMGTFPFVEIESKSKAKDCLMIMAGCPLPSNEATPAISIERKENFWLVKIKKSSGELSLKIYDTDVLPEYEVVENSFLE